MSFASIPGAQLYYESSGSGESAVVFVHGFSLDRRMWDDQFEVFSRGCRVVRYDMRGYGKSEMLPDVPYRHADDLCELLRVLGIGSAHLVGLSLGASVALELAASQPQMVSSLVLADTALE